MDPGRCDNLLTIFWGNDLAVFWYLWIFKANSWILRCDKILAEFVGYFQNLAFVAENSGEELLLFCMACIQLSFVKETLTGKPIRNHGNWHQLLFLVGRPALILSNLYSMPLNLSELRKSSGEQEKNSPSSIKSPTYFGFSVVSFIMGHYLYCPKDISRSGWIYEAENDPTLMEPPLFGPNSIWWRPKGEMANTWISRSLSQENWPSITVTQVQCQQKWVLPIIMMISCLLSNILQIARWMKNILSLSAEDTFANLILTMKTIIIQLLLRRGSLFFFRNNVMVFHPRERGGGDGSR